MILKKSLSIFIFALALYSFTFCDSLVSDKKTYNAAMAYHFDEPASIWEETFPLGNGRIGLMPDGGIEKETYILNEISLWSGSKQDTDNPDARESLTEIRRLLFVGKNDERCLFIEIDKRR